MNEVAKLVDAEIEHREQRHPFPRTEGHQQKPGTRHRSHKGLPKCAPIHYIVSARGTAN